LALKSKSIGNEIKNTFNELEIAGSAHRLRAAFAISYVRKSYLRARAIHGRAYDRLSVLHELAEAMGHNFIETLGAYLSDVIKEENAVPGEPVLVTLLESAPLVRGLAERLEFDPSIATAFAKFCAEHGIDVAYEDETLADIQRKQRMNRGRREGRSSFV
jgi:hypothetical protein